MGNLPNDFMFSQSSLQDFVDCRRRFELKYLLKQRFPAPQVDDILEFEHRMEQGERFHQLLHQHLIGIPSDLLHARIQDSEVADWFTIYLKNGLDNVPNQRYPEKTLTIPIGDYGLLAKIDLLAIGDTIQIIDWKTSRYIPQGNTLDNRLQTIVYRYVVAKGAAYLNGAKPIVPEQIEMVYWYAVHGGETRRFNYSQTQFEVDEAYLLQLIADIDKTQGFPLTSDERRCRFCSYRSLCDRGRVAGSLEEWDTADYESADLSEFEIDFEQIAEIEF
jgi:CRISPR/Cas system-associated exonuclease Cas4 (RecB family)